MREKGFRDRIPNPLLFQGTWVRRRSAAVGCVTCPTCGVTPRTAAGCHIHSCPFRTFRRGGLTCRRLPRGKAVAMTRPEGAPHRGRVTHTAHLQPGELHHIRQLPDDAFPGDFSAEDRQAHRRRTASGARTSWAHCAPPPPRGAAPPRAAGRAGRAARSCHPRRAASHAGGGRRRLPPPAGRPRAGRDRRPGLRLAGRRRLVAAALLGGGLSGPSRRRSAPAAGRRARCGGRTRRSCAAAPSAA